MYIDNYLNTPVSVNIELISKWKNIVTGLETKNDKPNEFMAPNIDILFDCPFLIGNLQELPSFWIDSIEHRFIGYNMGEFDKEQFIGNLKKAIQASINIIGDIPYQKYTFIAIGPGFGGIEHLNNTTVSFDGSRLNQKESMTKLMSFLTHEYFHHYNVKRIRPFELGPFCYDNENRTNLLWVSEGFTVYYEYIILRRANLISDQEFLESIEKKIMINENNPGRLFQSLSQSSYNTWSDGPFGKQGKDAGKTISYYDKGPLLGLILDLTIRNATDNKKSLDDVMKQLYWQFYKKLNRGFTDAELQQTCEAIAGISLSNEFEYVYSTNEIDYNKYLSYAGLKVTELKSTNNKRSFALAKLNNVNSLQIAILSGLQGK
jgi:predicted metalloprotease with PDZ domain